MAINKLHSNLFILLLGALIVQVQDSAAFAKVTSGQSLSDKKWNEISKNHSGDIYEVQKGETLWAISQKLFGNSNYWPKIWSINNPQITNPHFISAGQKLSFISGSSDDLPKLQDSNSVNSEQNLISTTKKQKVGTKDYLNIDPELWKPQENIIPPPPPQYDEFGFDKDIKIKISNKFTLKVPQIANETTIPYLGEIVGSRRDGEGLSQHEYVYIKSDHNDLQVGLTYSTLGDPEFFKEKKSDRAGYIYKATGEIRIIGVKDELFIGVVESAYDVIKRGHKLYPILPQITEVKATPGAQSIEALVVIGESLHTGSSQYRFIHLDRGLEDGVQIGNVFRVYNYYDPETRKKITNSDFLVHADVMVVHATAQFSTALILKSKELVGRGDFGVLLHDIDGIEKPAHKDLSHAIGVEGKAEKSEEDRELDELDTLDRDSEPGVGIKEKNEIKELEEWENKKDERLEKTKGEGSPEPKTETESVSPEIDTSAIPEKDLDLDTLPPTEPPVPPAVNDEESEGKSLPASPAKPAIKETQTPDAPIN